MNWKIQFRELTGWRLKNDEERTKNGEERWRMFLGMVFWWGFWLWVFGPFPCLFFLVRGEKVTCAQEFDWQSKGGDHFKLWFSFFSCLFVTILYCLVRRPFYIFLLFSSNLRSGTLSFVFFRFLIGNFFLLLLFSSDLWSRTFFVLEAC